MDLGNENSISEPLIFKKIISITKGLPIVKLKIKI